MTTDNPLTLELIDRCLTRDEHTGWRRKRTNLKKLDPAEFSKEHGRLVQGRAGTWTALDERVRYVDWGKWSVPDGEKAREYLRCAYLGQKVRWQWADVDLMKRINTSPSFHPGGAIGGEWAMIDIDSAFWQIMRGCTADMWLAVDNHLDRLFWTEGILEWPRTLEVPKALGRSIYGSCRSTDMIVWKNGVPDLQTRVSKFLAPGLVSYTLLVLHAIAWEAVTLWGCRLWSTDAAAVPRAYGLEYQEWLLERWCLRSHVKAAGRGHLYGPGRWHIGRKVTETVKRGNTLPGLPADNIIALGPVIRQQLADIQEHNATRLRVEPVWPRMAP